MADFYKGLIPIFDDHSPHEATHPPAVGFGLVPRDYSIDPETMFAQPTQMRLIPAGEWDARYDEQEATQSSLEHLYLSGPNGAPAFDLLDQNGFPDCWAHSTGHAIMMDRLRQNLPVVRLNAVAVATMLHQTQGGWCGLSAKFAREKGYPEIGTGPGQWPYQSRKGTVTPELTANMTRHMIVDSFVDLTKEVYDQNLTMAQLQTCLFQNNASPVDFNYWSHSVCGIRWVRIEPGAWGLLILNSWANWGRHGLAVLRGNKAIPNGALSLIQTTASV